MKPKVKVLIIALENLERDFRIHKQYKTLSKHFKVTIAAYSPPNNYSGEFIELCHTKQLHTRIWIELSKLFTKKKTKTTTWKTRANIKCIEKSQADYDVIVCNDTKSLPIGVLLKKNTSARLVLDAHEYAPGQKSNTEKRSNKAKLICEECLTHVDQAITVSRGIVQLYKKNFGKNFNFLPNIPYQKSVDLLESKCARPFQLICHGSGAQNRGLHELIQVAALTPKWHLNLMLVPPSKGEALKNFLKLKKIAENIENVTFRDPVPASEVVEAISAYDAGIYLMPGVSLNHIHALPNKFFDFIQAGLAIFVGPDLLEMSQFVQVHQCGSPSQAHTPESMAEL